MDIRSLDISQLTCQEKLDLIEWLWGAIDATAGQSPPSGNWPQEPEAFLDPLDREIEDDERDPTYGLPWRPPQ